MDSATNNELNAIEEYLKITMPLSAEYDLDVLLSNIVSSTRKLTFADAGMVYMLDKTKQYLYVKEFQSETLGETESRFPQVNLYVDGNRNMKHVAAYTAFSGKLFQIEDIYKYSGFEFSDIYHHDKKMSYKTRSLTTMPLKNHEGLTVGILVLMNFVDPKSKKIGAMRNELVSSLNAVSAQAAVAINNVQLVNENKRLISVLNSTNNKLKKENKELRTTIQGKYDFSNIIGESKAMKNVFSLMGKIIESDATVLVRGQTGTGKELIAHALHYNSGRKRNQFVVQNCAALPENLLESELFGYKKGAFSGANTDKKGLIELADGGTLFLDEIGDMPIGLQAKLLRVLQDKRVRPLGSVDGTGRYVDVRIVAATHCDLKEKIEAKEFREDLYYRLCVFPIDLPTIKERTEDIPALLNYFLNIFSGQYKKEISGFSPKVLDLLLTYPYPGNIRDLKNIVERAVLMCEPTGSILKEHLSEEVLSSIKTKKISKGNINIPEMGALKDMLAVYEEQLITAKLSECQWNQTKAASELNIARRTIIEKINKYGIEKNYSSAH